MPATVKRLDDWEKRLTELLLHWQWVRFSWGQTDCSYFAAEIYKALTGIHIKLPDYRTEHGALLAIKKMGYDDLAGYVSAHLGNPVATLKDGYIVQVHQPENVFGGALGVYVGERIYVPARFTGLANLDPDKAQKIWRT